MGEKFFHFLFVIFVASLTFFYPVNRVFCAMLKLCVCFNSIAASTTGSGSAKNKFTVIIFQNIQIVAHTFIIITLGIKTYMTRSAVKDSNKIFSVFIAFEINQIA